MVLVNYAGKEINAKLVYYGPGLSGKTTNLEFIYDSVPAAHRGKMVSMKTRTERTLFFDFLPVDLGEMGGFKTRFLLYTVPGQVYYNATRKLVLTRRGRRRLRGRLGARQDERERRRVWRTCARTCGSTASIWIRSPGCSSTTSGTFPRPLRRSTS